jgi:hypothetical protein
LISLNYLRSTKNDSLQLDGEQSMTLASNLRARVGKYYDQQILPQPQFAEKSKESTSLMSSFMAGSVLTESDVDRSAQKSCIYRGPVKLILIWLFSAAFSCVVPTRGKSLQSLSNVCIIRIRFSASETFLCN